MASGSSIIHLCKGLFTSRNIGLNPLKRVYFYRMFRNRIEMLLSAQTIVGQVLVILVFVLSIGSLIIYFINSTDPIGRCTSYEDKTVSVDLGFNAFFSFYFGLRFWAAEDKIKFWLEMNSIVDIFTIPPTFISYYLKSNWLGLRFLRALRLLELPKILHILQIIKSSNSVKLSKLLSILLSTWFTAAGFLHLVENSGDPWLHGRNSQPMSYFESVYLVTATMSTVGFGDVVAKTSLGRTFIVFFTLGSLVLFANYIPEMVELLTNRRKFTKPYEAVKGKKFIVVCGNITIDSVTAFLRNFLRHKSGVINTEVVFLGEAPPSLELETLLKCYFFCTTFVCGSALKFEDLKRVAVESAEACLILANPLCSDSHAEDNSNIMRVLSIKNYNSQVRVIIQILQSHNKVFLSKIPTWNWSAGDNIICFAELKLGFIAQGCLVPGLCTFLTTLFIEQNQKVFPKHPWQKYFLNSLKNKIVTQRLSDDFVGMTFPEVCRLCFVKMNLMLIAIQHKSIFNNCCSLLLNPSAQVKLNKDTLGFFIAESSQVAKRAFFYCSSCHCNVNTPELIEECGCKNRSQEQLAGPDIVVMKSNSKSACSSENQDLISEEHESLLTITSLKNRNMTNDTVDDAEQLDSSGLFHWCKSMPLDKVVLKRTDKPKHEFRNHIIACVFGDAHSALVGLQNFVMPLRASNYTRRELKDIVFIGALEYFQREWRFLRNFPQIYIMPGSALYTGDLHAVNIEQCSMCAILASPSKALSSQILVDTETIMATLNIQSFRVSYPTQVSSVPDTRAASTFNKYGQKIYKRIPILTELKNPSNIHFIEQIGGLDGTLKGTSLHLSTSFSTGAVFSGNFLDSLLATAFYNYHVLELLQMLVTGGISAQMEQCLVKEKYYGIHEGCATVLSGRARCKLGLLSLDQTILSDIEPRKTFGQLFCGSLDNYGILCVGLYRVMDEQGHNPEHKRFVITRPANECCLLPSDLVFCAIPFSTDCYKTENVPSAQILDNLTNVMSVAPETHLSIQHLSKLGTGIEKTSHHTNSRVYPLESFTTSDFNLIR
ncbi:potassium channel subfamily U member 1 isoform X2 [Mesocricetus auratus]|uniref:BK channel n=1 Tax=Mesocricetus auratus TaxID=10036 RepID=A0ABM2W9P0_MESAU|nr:potassium channel subfamily U member 1 isoform X2 [Mesocricetus auratus]XP_040587677.1 potassium channel subfamily U member 1 isoform X2 [Mesocricetus auratus]XP_040587678.1 potassium channel subfamily U member 1 isoform X2 [Mesocricetus auratus]XP_040587679.1 potassium channel subfamily U member 1 isoform X2 [Mesocricetus auratus]